MTDLAAEGDRLHALRNGIAIAIQSADQDRVGYLGMADRVLDQIAAALRERDELRQAIWGIDAILGFDHDGDETPDALTRPSLIDYCTGHARFFRADYDGACEELDALRVRAETLQADADRLATRVSWHIHFPGRAAQDDDMASLARHAAAVRSAMGDVPDYVDPQWVVHQYQKWKLCPYEPEFRDLCDALDEMERAVEARHG